MHSGSADSLPYGELVHVGMLHNRRDAGFRAVVNVRADGAAQLSTIPEPAAVLAGAAVAVLLARRTRR